MSRENLEEQVILKLTDREHILLRPGMYLGSTVLETISQYLIEENKFIKKEVQYVPGLIKIFNELIDNSLDEFVRTSGAFADIIHINLDSEKFEVKDNGRGIPVKIAHDKIYMPEIAWTEARAGSNFQNEKSTTIGTNGVGSMISSVFSREFIGYSDDGINKLKVHCLNNNKIIKSTLQKTSKTGVQVTIKPDLERFNLTEITPIHIKIIEQSIYNLSVAYPGITFKFNNKSIKLKSKDYIQMFSLNGLEVLETPKYTIAVLNSPTDEFQQFSLMNGLLLSEGGNHIDLISLQIVNRLREKLLRKFKTIKPGDIKSKLFIITIFKDFEGPTYNSQTKERLTSSAKNINEYLGDIDYDKFVAKILRNNSIIEPIVDYFRIKQEMTKQKELKGLDKKKKIKSENYLPATKNKKILFLAEGQSALGGLLPALGREDYGFYALKGVPLNAYDSPQSKFTQNKELSELYQIIQNEGADFYQDGNFYELEIDGKITIVNEYDEVLIENKWIVVRDLVES